MRSEATSRYIFDYGEMTGLLLLRVRIAQGNSGEAMRSVIRVGQAIAPGGTATSVRTRIIFATKDCFRGVGWPAPRKGNFFVHADDFSELALNCWHKCRERSDADVKRTP